MNRKYFLLYLKVVFLGAVMWHGSAGAQRIRVASSSPSLTARLPHLVAHEEGFFKQQGLDVESIVVRNDAIILAALAAGEFSYVETGAPSPVAAIAKGLPFVIVGGFRSRLDYIMIGRKGFSSPESLKGAVIGATGAGGLSESVVIAAMKNLGFQRDRDYKILYVGNSPLRMLALEQGRIDASIFTPHQQLILLQKGYHSIMDVGKLLPEIPSLLLSTTRESRRESGCGGSFSASDPSGHGIHQDQSRPGDRRCAQAKIQRRHEDRARGLEILRRYFFDLGQR